MLLLNKQGEAAAASLHTRFTAAEKEQYRKYLTSRLYRYGWGVEQQELYLATVCRDPKISLMAHFDTGKTLPWYITGFYKIFGYERKVYLPIIILSILSFLVLQVPVISLLFLVLLAISLLLRPKNQFNYNDNTSGVMLLLEIAGRFPNLQDKVQLVFTDEEERGRKGAKQYSERKPGLVLNFDTVGLGDTLVISFNKHKPPPDLLKIFDDKRYKIVVKKRFSNSDYGEFDNGIGFTFVKKSCLGGYYLPNVHTPKDIVIDFNNIEWLVSRITALLELSGFLRKECIKFYSY